MVAQMAQQGVSACHGLTIDGVYLRVGGVGLCQQAIQIAPSLGGWAINQGQILGQEEHHIEPPCELGPPHVALTDAEAFLQSFLPVGQHAALQGDRQSLYLPTSDDLGL